MTNLYNHQDLHEMNLYPCAYSMTFNVSGNVLNGILNQRSQDMLTANNWNVTQYAVLLHMFASVSGLQAGELVHVIADAHIYDRHVPIVKEMIEKTPYDAPKFIMDPEIHDFYSFTKDSFRLEDYQYHAFTDKIPVAIKEKAGGSAGILNREKRNKQAGHQPLIPFSLCQVLLKRLPDCTRPGNLLQEHGFRQAADSGVV